MDEFIYNEPIHKDFQINMNQLIRFIRETYGEDVLNKYFFDIGEHVYKPLVDRIRKNGLIEMKKHLERVFDNEGGKYEIKFNKGELIFKVLKCPAISYLKRKKVKADKAFCHASTELINKGIASACGCKFSVVFDQKNGKCTQKFMED